MASANRPRILLTTPEAVVEEDGNGWQEITLGDCSLHGRNEEKLGGQDEGKFDSTEGCRKVTGDGG